MILKNLLKTLLALAVFTILVSSATFAQLSTVYVDVTNGSDTYTGANAINNPAGSGPKATIDAGLKALANNGTLVIMAGTYDGVDGNNTAVTINTTNYPNLKAGGSLTIQLQSLNSNSVINLATGGTFTYDIPNGTLNVTSGSGAESLTLPSGITLGSLTDTSTVNISNSNYVQIPSGSTITLYNSSMFSAQAPKSGANISLSYIGAATFTGSFTAGAESNYGSYGTGTITVNDPKGSITFPNTITSVAGFTLTSGNATFSGAVTLADNITVASGNATFNNTVSLGTNDIFNNGNGAITFNSGVNFSITTGSADANLGRVVNASTGSITFSGTATWNGTFGATNTYANYVIDNQSTGAIAFNSNLSFVSPNSAGFVATLTANNGGGGTLTLGTIGYTTPSTSNIVLNVQSTAANGHLNLAGGSITGFLTNVDTTTVNGALSLAGVLTNSKLMTLGVNTLTLSGNNANATNGGTITATTGGLLVTASGANSFDGGTLSNLTINGGGTTSILGAAVDSNLTVTKGTLTVSANLTSNGTTTLNGGTVNVGAFTFQTLNYQQSSGTFSLAASASSILNVLGNFSNTAGANTFTAGTGSLVEFTGATAQTFAGGPLITVSNLTFNNTKGIITVSQSVRATGLVTIAAKTNVALSTLNIILFANNAGISNLGSYTATGGGGVIFGGVNTITGAVANYTGQTLSGTGSFSNITVDVGTSNFITTPGGNNVTFNGVLYLRSGDLQITSGDFGPTGTSALINRDISTGSGSANGIVLNGGTFNTNKPTVYDLTYSGSLTTPTSVAVGTTEFSAAYVRNLTISTSEATATNLLTLTSASTVTINGNLTLTTPTSGYNEFDLPAQVDTVYGTLYVQSGTVLGGGAAADSIFLPGSGLTHVVAGKVSNLGVLTVTGSGSALNGSTVKADAATIVTGYAFEPAANSSSFNSANLKTVGNITVQGSSSATGASATITMNDTTATLGNLSVGNGGNAPTVNFTLSGKTSPAQTGNIMLTNGNLTYTRVNDMVLGGGVTLTAGTLTLGSNLSVTGATAQAKGNINTQSYTYTQLGGQNYTRTNSGTFAGTLILDATNGNISVIPGASFVVPNLQSIGTANGVSAGKMTVSNSLLLDNASTFAESDTLFVSGNTVSVTNDFGGFTGALDLMGSAATATFGNDYTIPTLVVNSTGTVTIASDKSTARTITVNTAFNNVAGTLALGINNLVITNPATFTYKAGAITQGTGMLTWNTGGAFTLAATGFSIDNLTVSTAVNVGTSAFSVNKNLILSAGITTSADGKLTLGDGIQLTRTANAATLSNIPTFAGKTNVTYNTYTGAVDITTGNELPTSATNLNNLTVSAGANHVVLASAITVNGTLTLANLLDNTNKAITMANASTLVLQITGTSALSKDLVKAGSMSLVYDGATSTSTRELGALPHPTYTGAITVKSATVQLDGDLTTSGVFTLSGGSFDMNGNNLSFANDVIFTSASSAIVNSGAAKALSFTGNANTALTLQNNWAVPATINFTLNKTNGKNMVTFSGGNLSFVNPSATGPNLFFVNGLLVAAGNQTVTLVQNNSGNGQAAIQGYDRTGVTGTNMSQIVGKVIKNVVAGANGVGRYEFPVGSDTAYMPAAFTFPSNPVYGFNLAVAAVDTTPAGTNGLSALNLAYPNFYWLISSDVNLGTAITFNLELTAQGFANFSNIADLKIIRRVDGDTTANQWVLQGSNYDNYLVGSTPTVDNTGSTGGINPAGARFTYGLKVVAPTAFTVSGKVTYGNGATGVKNVIVTLNPGGMTATTDTTGAYSIANVPNGTYTVAATSSNAWLGANATDALLASNYYNGTQTLTTIQQLAADVNVSGSVNNTDALLIVRRFAGLDNSFAAGNWVFTTANLTVNGANATANLSGLVAGDVNASDDLSTLKRSSTVSVVSEGQLKVNGKDAIEIPVEAGSNMSLGAISLRLTYPTNLVTFEGATSGASVIANDQNGHITIAWADLSGGKNPFNVKAGESLVTLKFKPTAEFKTGTQFSLSVDNDASEFAKEDGSVLSSASIKVPSVEATVPTQFALKQNYPNPFNPSTTIEYDLPANGMVRLVIYNVLGQEVATLVNQMENAGSYKIVWNADNLASGMYIYRMTVESGSQKFTQVHRMMLLK